MIKKTLFFSQGIRKIPYLNAFLPNCELVSPPVFRKGIDQVIGWGLRPSTKKARAYAQKYHLPYIALEDGFLRSLGLGVAGYPPYSMVVDKLGIYYDTTRPSGLEQLILQCNLKTDDFVNAERAMRLIVDYQLSKYNHALDAPIFTNQKPIVLVLDQTFGDMAVKYGQADEQTFQQMLQAAIRENPHAEIWVKTHPDVLSGKKQGYLTTLLEENVHLYAEDVNPISLLKQVEKVYCVTSQMGFEALLCGKPVVTFGVPWFAGWGVTDDRHPNVEKLRKTSRRTDRLLPELFHSAYIAYSRYVDPQAGKLTDIFTIIEYLRQMKTRNILLAGKIYCVGVSLWKRAFLKAFFEVPSCKLKFVSAKKLQRLSQTELNDAKLLVWGQGKTEYLDFAQQHQLEVLRMEDGFVRSVGLGSNLVVPLSLVVDDLGIYFNPQQPSRLENILQNQYFSEQDCKIAEQVRATLIKTNIGKYNVGERGFTFNSQGKKSILVPGQVEDDASIRLGTSDITNNLMLLKQVRLANPNAFILYKPHPDVVSGNRIGNIPNEQALQFADLVVENADILDCINQVDEIHTMTSLAGFEALLRDKIVHCYGAPFYAGWGLTVDYQPVPRRTRELSLAELIAGVLIYYPFYISPQTKQGIGVQYAIEILHQQRLEQKYNGIKRSWLAKQWGKLIQLALILK